MRWLDKVRMLTRTLLRPKTEERELDAELRFHLEHQIAQNLAAGMSAGEARRVALLDFGGLEQMKEDCRDMRKANWIEDLLQDIRYAARMLGSSRGFTAVALLTLALGIGANTAIFSVVDAVLLKPLPFRQPENVVALWETESAPGSFPLNGGDYLDWREHNKTFEDMALYSWPNSANVSAKDSAEGAPIIRTHANFFSLLGVPAQIGRTCATGEDQTGGSHVAILSDAFWKKQFGARPDIVSGTLRLNGEPYTVIGVMPAWYRMQAAADLWVPLDMAKDKLGPRGNHQWRSIGRVKSGVAVAQARADLHTIAQALAKQYPEHNRGVDAIVKPMKEDLIGDFSSQVLILFGAVALVLLIACANVANLLLARSTSRRREIAVRNALGAGRGRLVRQMLAESLLLSLVGGLLGVAVAYVGVTILRSWLPATIPQPNPITVGLQPLLFTLVISLFVGALFGLAPALQSSSVESTEALKPKGMAGDSASKRGQWLRDALVVGELALSLALLIGAGLLLRTFANLRATDTGVRGDGVLTGSVLLPAKKYETFEQARAFYLQLLEKLQAAPGIRAAAIATKLPMRGGNNGYIKIPGQQEEEMSGPLVETTSVRGEYFKAFRIPLLAGREFQAQDYELTAKFMREYLLTKIPDERNALAKKYELPVVINQTMARTFWPKQEALGKVFENFMPFRVIGVVGDVKQQELRSAAMPEAYYPLEWDLNNPNMPYSIVVAGSAAGGEALTPAVRGAVQSMDDSLALMSVRTMPQIIAESMLDTQYEAALLGTMAILALILAAVGTYGVMSYIVGRRTNEIGIRMALGAARPQIIGLVLRQAGTLILLGIVIGLLGAGAAARLMHGLLVGVQPVDPLTYGSLAGVLAGVALLACLLPVRRAMRVDPMVALRYE
jgi:putative ABC transport system permease protein